MVLLCSFLHRGRLWAWLNRCHPFRCGCPFLLFYNSIFFKSPLFSLGVDCGLYTSSEDSGLDLISSSFDV
nr:hypothetical protein CFP56_35446 [Quercus suber]